MTSDTADTQAVYSAARTSLAFAMGERYVSLSDLSPKEFDIFLAQQLHSVELKELRGFIPLRDILSFRRDEPIELADSGQFSRDSLDKHANLERIGLNVHAAKVCRGVCRQTLYYKRLESGEETMDLKKADGWGNAYLRGGQETILVMARPTKHAVASENLFAVDYSYSKVPHKKQHLIHTVSATQIPVDKFRDFFSEKATSIARDLIWELKRLHSYTLSELKSQTERMQQDLMRWNRVANSIS